MTVSIGGVLVDFTEDKEFDHIYHEIDEALYSSKRQGRNKVTIIERD